MNIYIKKATTLVFFVEKKGKEKYNSRTRSICNNFFFSLKKKFNRDAIFDVTNRYGFFLMRR
jgi:hypothetical protein